MRMIFVYLDQFCAGHTKKGVERRDDKDYLSHYRIVDSNSQVFSTTLLTLLPVLFARFTEAGFFYQCFSRYMVRV